MTKGDLINSVAKAAKVSKRVAGDAVDTAFGSIAKAIKEDKRLQVPGFGTFTVRSARQERGGTFKPAR